jgi:hypothetical protein
MVNRQPYSNFTVPEQLHVQELSFDGRSVTIHASTEEPCGQVPGLWPLFTPPPQLLPAYPERSAMVRYPSASASTGTDVLLRGGLLLTKDIRRVPR